MAAERRDDVFSAVSSVLTGTLAPCRAAVLPGTTSEVVSASRLLARDEMTAALDRYAATFPGADPRAAVSMWASWYFGIFIPPALASCVMLEKHPALGPPDVGLHITPAGHVGAVRFGRLVENTAPDDPLARIEPMLDHLAMFVDALAAFGPSARLLWCSAASYAEWTAAAIAAEAGFRQLPDRLLKSQMLPGGRKNPLFDRLRMVEEDGVAVSRRRVCCLRYQLPGMPGCGATCPLPEGRTDTPR